jgi:hypothetical protein
LWLVAVAVALQTLVVEAALEDLELHQDSQ